MTPDDAKVAFNEWIQHRGGEAIAEIARRCSCGQNIIELHFEEVFLAGARACIDSEIRTKLQQLEAMTK